MRPTEILMQQRDFVQRMQSKSFRQVVESSIRSNQPNLDERDLTDHITRTFADGDTYSVSADMVDLIEYSAHQLDESDRADIDLFPSRSGVVSLEVPLVFEDIRGYGTKIHWISWGIAAHEKISAFGARITKRSMLVSFWTDMSDPDEIATELYRKVPKGQVAQMVGRWGFVGVGTLEDGARLGTQTYTIAEHDDEAYWTNRRQQEIAEQMDTLLRPPLPTAKVPSLRRYVWAMVLLMGQEIVSKEQSTHTKAESKVLARNGAGSAVTVVTLRRKSHRRSEGESRVGWAHRWLVKGFWAWRKCGENHPASQEYEKGYRARVWINDYVKGPEGKSFKVTDKVYRLSR